MAHRGQELGLETRQLLKVLVALRQIGQEHRLLSLGHDGGFSVRLELRHDAAHEDAERDKEQAFEQSGGRIAGRGVDPGDEDEVGDRERRTDRKLDGRVVQSEKDQRQEHEGKSTHDAQAELNLEGKRHRERSDRRDGMEVPWDSLPRKKDERAAEDRDHGRGDDAEHRPVGPQRVESKHKAADNRYRGDDHALRRRIDLGQRDQDKRDADRHRAA